MVTEDASIGISENSVIYNNVDLHKQIKFLRKNYNQDILIEQYIEGRELNVSILGNQILPISEITFNGIPEGLPKIVTYEAKWSPESVYYENTVPVCPAELAPSKKKKIEMLAYAAFKAVNGRDYARVDIRLDKNEIPYIIEINHNPDISEDSGFIRSAKKFRLSYSGFLKTIANFALKRGIKD